MTLAGHGIQPRDRRPQPPAYETNAGLDDGRRPAASPLLAAKRFWPVTLVLALLGLAGGVAYSSSQPTTFTAERRASVGGQNVAFYAVPGYALAAQELASNYARYVGAKQFATPLIAALTPAQQKQLTGVVGSAIPESNWVRVITTATDPTVATIAADTVTKALVEEANANSTTSDLDKALSDYQTLSTQVASAQNRVDTAKAALTVAISAAKGVTTGPAVKAAQDEYQSAIAALAPLQLKQTAAGTKYQSLATAPPTGSNLVISDPAVVTGSDKTARAERYGLGGLVIGLIVAMIVTRALSRRPRRSTYAPRRGMAEPGRA
jgi:hypothetical protein